MPNAYETGRGARADPSAVQTRADLAALLGMMLADYRAAGAHEWENGTLDRFLDALQAVVHDGVHPIGVDPEDPSWHMLAHLLVSAAAYE